MTEIRRLAIANRGDAAARALTAVADINQAGEHPPITTVVLHTDPDAQAWYVRKADEALCIGPATYVDPADGHRKSRYLDEPNLISALIGARVDAVWAGWGFVAERASFARRCEEAGIVFVGPDSATIRLLGNKIASKRLAERTGLPVVPWSGGPVHDGEQAEQAASALGYPVVIKAAAGGGGRGIRIVRDPAELPAALQSARSEAELAFGDPTVFLERLVSGARHVEVQIIVDACGTAWAPGVRDCSIQRRHQKVIEESGSTVLDASAEEAMRQAAVRLATAAGYRNAGTVEFLVSPDGTDFRFMEVNTRLQVEHPVTEMTTGLDLVKLQLHVASGGRLGAEPPRPHGHAVEARLCAEDPERFEPAPGRIAMLSIPTGTGIRVDTGVREGDDVSAEFDSMIAKIIAWGNSRAEALARLRRAVAETTVVVEGGTTNRSFLLSILDRPEMRDGNIDNHWLDRLTAKGAHLPPAEPVALLQAAVEAYDADKAAGQAAFHARAARGGPEPATEAGRSCQLRYRGGRFRLRVYQTGPSTYRVAAGDALADMAVERVNRYERYVVAGGRRHRVVAVSDTSAIRIEVDNRAHRIARDDDGMVRSQWPAVVVSLCVAPGDVVAEGDPLLTLESMKMEVLITAPFGGLVAAVDVTANAQVDVGAPLLRISSACEELAPADPTAAVDLSGFGAPADPQAPPCEQPYSALRGYLLGYDLDAASVRDAITLQRQLAQAVSPDDPQLLRCEDSMLDLFADLCSLSRPATEPEPAGERGAGSSREHLLSFLQWLDADRAALPGQYRQSLRRALRRYGVDGLERTPALEEAVVWMFRSFGRLGELLPVVTNILERRLGDRQRLRHLAGSELRARLDRLTAAAKGRYPDLADLAGAARFHYMDEPVLRAVAAAEHARMERHLDALEAEPDGPGRQDLIGKLVRCRQPLRAMVLSRWLDSREHGQAGAWRQHAFRRALLEVAAQRLYRMCDLRGIKVERRGQHVVCSADYEMEDRAIHLVICYLALPELPELATNVAAHLATVDSSRQVVVDLHTWRHGEQPDDEEMVNEIAGLLPACDFRRPLRRLNVTLTSLAGHSAQPCVTQRATFRQREDGGFEEEAIYRNLHPVIAKRLELWRLANFRLRRLPSEEDVYVYHGVAHQNPKDQRLFVLAEVREMTAVVEASGALTYPWLKLATLSALRAVRNALAGFAAGERPTANRIVLFVRPPWEIPPQQWPDLGQSLAPSAARAGLHKVVLRVQIPEPAGVLRQAVLDVDCAGWPTAVVRERRPAREPIRPLTRYRQKVLRAQRFGAPYPYEIVRVLTRPPGAAGRFPPGQFAEYDLDGTGALVRISRRPGLNTANVVVGLITNYTAKVPEGMSRVTMLSDPTRGLGNLAEPECRRVIAALGLASRMRVPVEWYALSSGARIAMDSGTENMDWVAATLRRLVEFTQAGGEVNVIVTGVNAGAQPYWNAEATMLMHTRGILVMTPAGAMVLTGKQALDFSGGVSAEDNFGIGGFERIMGPNGQSQYWAPSLEEACHILLRHYDHTYVVPGEPHPRRAVTRDPADRDVRTAPHPRLAESDVATVGDVFSAGTNPERKKQFSIRAVLRAVTDTDSTPLERWAYWRGAETAVVWDAHIGGIPVCLLGMEAQSIPRQGFVPTDGPASWTSGTLFPQSARKLARAINAASGNRPVVVLANLSGFDGSPESMRHWQLEYGAEIGRAVTNFRGPIIFVVITRYHGGAFVVFSKRLNDNMEIAAVEGSYASVIGGVPAAATVFAREVKARTQQDSRLIKLQDQLRAARDGQAAALRTRLTDLVAAVRSEKLGELAEEFDRVHSIHRALTVGSVDWIIPACELRPYLVAALERGLRRGLGRRESQRDHSYDDRRTSRKDDAARV